MTFVAISNIGDWQFYYRQLISGWLRLSIVDL